jgi:hypothetical protein
MGGDADWNSVTDYHSVYNPREDQMAERGKASSSIQSTS